ncbi:hypothetical protein IC006_1978 [Sulfuracidifex tepidarius]|uniref:Uncharacterized protein n=1 Tax=Sulfuracidifex tepidarius TaxID=1294262 RepID=A0A510E4I4_9CREN|nr:hypothetical protein IC006_1978 [Sulfuracidifex tepidarius]BBG27435.1 hypothetical protein IC007_1986 [Sulfuracidifex tepidarius]
MKSPIVIAGIPISGSRNPVVTQISSFELGTPLEKVVDFIKIMEEATGFSCKVNPRGLSNSPLATSYVFSTREVIESFINCGVPATVEEMNEIAYEIDGLLFPDDKDMLKALRLTMEIGTPILFREGDEAVPIGNSFSARSIAFHPRDTPNFVDNSLIHLVGITAIEISQKLSENDVSSLFRFENGVWSAVYSLPVPEMSMVKWSWDLQGASLIELSR